MLTRLIGDESMPNEAKREQAFTLEPEMRALMSAVQRNNIGETQRHVASLINTVNTGLPLPFLSQVLHALETRDWSFFPKAFRNLEFVGRKGIFLLLAPYQAARGGKSERKLSAIF